MKGAIIWSNNRTDEPTLVYGSSVPLTHHDLSDPDPDHIKGTHQKTTTTTGQQ